MVRHLMLWKLSPGVQDRASLLEDTKRALESLKGEVAGLLDVKVSFSPFPSGADAMIECTFESYEALKEYKRHPLHIETANKYTKPFALSHLSFDIEES